ncbi:MAG: hypothetical protein GKS00_24620 [Alphaproteobacteria bacterium]|nr:hypothetical protein [Alphaproteobacteria bacterium]
MVSQDVPFPEYDLPADIADYIILRKAFAVLPDAYEKLFDSLKARYKREVTDIRFSIQKEKLTKTTVKYRNKKVQELENFISEMDSYSRAIELWKKQSASHQPDKFLKTVFKPEIGLHLIDVRLIDVVLQRMRKSIELKTCLKISGNNAVPNYDAKSVIQNFLLYYVRTVEKVCGPRFEWEILEVDTIRGDQKFLSELKKIRNSYGGENTFRQLDEVFEGEGFTREDRIYVAIYTDLFKRSYYAGRYRYMLRHFIEAHTRLWGNAENVEAIFYGYPPKKFGKIQGNFPILRVLHGVLKALELEG